MTDLSIEFIEARIEEQRKEIVRLFCQDMPKQRKIDILKSAQSQFNYFQDLKKEKTKACLEK